MPHNRTQSPASSSKDNWASVTAAHPKPARAGKRTAANNRFAERQARKHRALLDARRARNRRYGIVSIAMVVVLVAALVIVKVVGGGSGRSDIASPPAGTPVPEATLTKLASVPVSTLAAAPTNGLLNQAQPIRGSQPLSANGKPELLFVGAEYCPHCAAERWPLYVALSKFGTFSPAPGRIHSATLDGNVPTLTFYGTTYSSPYFAFDPVEVYTNKPDGRGGYTPLQVLTRSQLNMWQSLGGGTFPLGDFGNSQAQVGAQYSYGPLQDLSFGEVAAQVGNNSTSVGANIDASA